MINKKDTVSSIAKFKTSVINQVLIRLDSMLADKVANNKMNKIRKQKSNFVSISNFLLARYFYIYHTIFEYQLTAY